MSADIANFYKRSRLKCGKVYPDAHVRGHPFGRFCMKLTIYILAIYLPYPEAPRVFIDFRSFRLNAALNTLFSQPNWNRFTKRARFESIC